MRFLGITMFLLAILFSSPSYASGLSDLSDLQQVEKQCSIASGDFTTDEKLKHELAVIHNALTKADPGKRAEVLRRLADKTKWGSPERLAAYYICAWYGVNYERCRDYLLNSFFFGERYYRRELNQLWPSTWAEGTPSLLYEIYKRNHDFRILHDLVTGHSDGAGVGALDDIRVKAMAFHPRGVLHIAQISPKGREFAVEALTGRYHWESWDKEMKQARSTYPYYVRRIAADKKDPLCKTAQSLLLEAKKKRK